MRPHGTVLFGAVGTPRLGRKNIHLQGPTEKFRGKLESRHKVLSKVKRTSLIVFIYKIKVNFTPRASSSSLTQRTLRGDSETTIKKDAGDEPGTLECPA